MHPSTWFLDIVNALSPGPQRTLSHKWYSRLENLALLAVAFAGYGIYEMCHTRSDADGSSRSSVLWEGTIRFSNRAALGLGFYLK